VLFNLGAALQQSKRFDEALQRYNTLIKSHRSATTLIQRCGVWLRIGEGFVQGEEKGTLVENEFEMVSVVRKDVDVEKTLHSAELDCQAGLKIATQTENTHAMSDARERLGLLLRARARRTRNFTPHPTSEGMILKSLRDAVEEHRAAWALRPTASQKAVNLASAMLELSEAFSRSAQPEIAKDSSRNQQELRQEALKVYEHVMKVEPTNTDATHALAYESLRSGSFKLSAKLYALASSLDPGNSQIFAGLGTALMEAARRSNERPDDKRAFLEEAKDAWRVADKLGGPQFGSINSVSQQLCDLGHEESCSRK
jgi:tetratricopeptide (TPR) repeat protein